MGRSSLAHLVTIQFITLLTIAYLDSAGARERGGREPTGVLAFDAREQTRTSIRGELKCPLPEENTGGACTLSLTEIETGQVYRILGSSDAMRLYQDGHRQVIATGTLQGDRLRILNIRAE